MNNIKCQNHPETMADTAFHKPGVDIKFFCEPCAKEYRATTQTEYKSKRESYTYTLNDERDRQRATYGYSDWDFGDANYNKSPERKR